MNYIVSGLIASGKDAVAALLPGTRYAFAEDLKALAMLLRIHDLNGACDFFEKLVGGYSAAPMDTREKLRSFMTYPKEAGKDRRLFQDLGTWGRSVNPDIWVNSVKRRVARCSTPAIITDCRFHNELAAFPEFKSVYVFAPEEIRMGRMVSRDGEVKAESLCHPAESEIQGLQEFCDYTLHNDGTIEDLQWAVKRMEAWFSWE